MIGPLIARTLLARTMKGLVLTFAFGFASTTLSLDSPLEWGAIQQEATELFVRYLRIDTTNPPGNEMEAAKFFAAICQREGIESRIFESAPGRGIIWARLQGNGSQRPIVLLNHLDVVPHSPEYWSAPAFGGLIKGNFIYGRGALDMKSLGIAQFQTLLVLKRARVPLARDVIFLGTPDEEAGGILGAGWFVRNHPELLGNAEFLFNEGGSNFITPEGQVKGIGLSPSEKTPAWFKLTATGEPGHASVPRPDSSVNRLLRALNRLLDYNPPLKPTPPVEQAFRSFSRMIEGPMAARYAAIGEALRDPVFRQAIESDPQASALLRNTISITMLEGSGKINVIPPIASARIDTRLVPGENINQWIAELKGVIRDEKITIEPILAFESNSSPIDSTLVRTVQSVVERKYRGAVMTWPVVAGFTDSHFFRDLGIMSYGFSPFVAPVQDLGQGYHGNDERIGRKAFTDGVRFFYEVVEPLVRQM